MPDTLKLYYSRGSATPVLDLSNYVDVAKGGINPGDADVVSPVWADPGVGYGTHLVGAVTQNRPFQSALLLTASTMAALRALEQDVVRYLNGPSPVIEWKAEAAAASTFYLVRHGKLLGDDRYDQRLENQASASRRQLVAVCAPYGIGLFPNQYPLQTAPPVKGGLATWSGSGYGASNPAIGAFPSIGGDAPVSWALSVWATIAASAPSANVSYQSALMWAAMGRSATLIDPLPLKAATPLAAVTPLLFTNIGAGIGGGAATSILADPWAPGGGKAVQFTGTRMTASGPWSGASPGYVFSGYAGVPAGLYRAFLAARYRQDATALAGSAAVMRLWWDYTAGPAVALLSNSPSTWRWYDAGDVAVMGAQTIISLEAAYASGATHAASPHFNVSGIALIPKDQGYTFIRPLPANSFNGVAINGDDEGVGMAIGGGLENPQLMSGGGVLADPGAADVQGETPHTLPAPSGAPGTSYLSVLVQVGIEPARPPIIEQTMHDRVVARLVVAAFDRYTFAK